MQLIKINKKTNNKIEQAKCLVSIFCLLSSIKLSDTDMTVLSYFMVYNINQTTKDLILKSKILLNEDSLKNTISKLKGVGLIKKSSIRKEYLINDSLSINLDSVTAVLIKIDNK